MALKVGDSQISQSRGSGKDGSEVTLTESYDAEGKKVDVVSHIRKPSGEEITVHGDEAMVQRPDGSVSYFKLTGGGLQFREGLLFKPTGEAISVAMSHDQIEQDKALIESARLMMQSAGDMREVEDDLFTL